ncbi:MAG: discoidin domain-containing protein [Clostridia bacterium]|nr:discoidin domain-containing protein [Clostridia bacterium]
MNKANKTRFRRRAVAALTVIFALMCLAACTPGGDPGATATPGKEDPTMNASSTPDPGAEDPALNVFPNDGKNIEIGIFWEPPKEYTTAEQYDRIRDAHITFIEITNREGAVDKETSDLQLKLAGERGIGIFYKTGVDGKKLTQMSEKAITEYVQELAKNPTISGIHVVDEPSQPWTYAKVLKAITKGGLTPRLNMLPYFATWVFENYRGFVEDSVIAAGPENYGFLQYDQYPFPYNGGDPDMFYNLDLFREIGLKYDIPTAFYIQSIGEGGNFRRTNGGEIRYHTSAGLAYGLKSMTYFTWWTTGFCDPKDYGIISPYGEKTSIYDDVASIDAQILTTGPLLARLDALEVFHTGGSEDAITLCTADTAPLYAEPKNGYGLIVSLMEDRETGRDYVMLVNKNYKESVSYELSVSSKLTHLYDCTNGSYEELDIRKGTVKLDFEAGGYRLLAAGQHDVLVERQLDKGANLAQEKPVSVADVEPGGGFYAFCLTDGFRTDKYATSQGYHSPKNSGYIEVDLLRVTEINRVDLYPTGSNFTRGETFPRAFTLEISKDGENWTKIAEESDYTAAEKAVPVFRFDKTEARFVRLNVTAGGREKGFEIGEIEVYNDSGDIPEPDNASLYADATQTAKGENIAKGKSVKVSSDLGGDWSKKHITDGKKSTCWSSALNRHATEDGVEWIRIDLGAPLEFNEVVVRPRGDGQNFPYNFRVEISDDGNEFTSVYECAVPELPSKGEASVCTLDKTYTARYVRIYAYKLRDQEGFNDGHIFQVSEVEIYNK